MLLQPFDRSAPGLKHYDDMLALTGRQYRFAGEGLAIGVVLGMLDTRTGRLPIGLVDARNAYWADTLYYDANRRTIDVYDQRRWRAFVGTYAGGGWLLGLVTGLGSFALMIVGAFGSAVMESFASAVIPAVLFGLIGMLVYLLVGYALFQVALQFLPYLIGGVAIWGSLCALIALERHTRCNRIGRALETLIEQQLMPIFT